MSTLVSTQTVYAAFKRVYATNVTLNAYTAKADLTAAEFAAKYTAATNGGNYDTTNGYLDLSIGQLGDAAPDLVKIKFYGLGTNTQTGACRIYGVSRVTAAPAVLGESASESYTHVLLGGYTFALSSALTGVAGGVVPATQFYADTITAVIDVANVSDMIISPTGGVPAHLVIDVKGFQYLLVEPIVGNATSVNVLVAGY